MTRKIIILFISILIIYLPVYAGGPWTKEKGNAFIKLSEYWVVFDQHYNDNGKIIPNVNSSLFNTTLYTEFGLSNDVNFIFNGTLLSINQTDDLISDSTGQVVMKGKSISTLGDIDVGIKYKLTNKESKFPFAISLIFGLPTGNTSNVEKKNLQTGDGEFNQLLQIDAGKSFHLLKNISTYTSAYIGLNNRTDNFSDEFRYGLELGVGLFNQKVWLIGRVNSVSSFRNGNTKDQASFPSVFANNTEYVGITLEINYLIKNRIGISAAIGGAASASNIAAAPSYAAGIFYEISK